ncbi:MAG: hypothetical protein CMJ48_13745 [Planctomycetaceae bacterium]|nr:hypothetical protein [Planctomycetaceae bacterium]
MAQASTLRQKLLLVALAPLVLAVLLLVVLLASCYYLYRFLLRLILEVRLLAGGRRILLVYSRSPVWQEHVESNWLPRLGEQAMILNWSDRAKWYKQWSLPVCVFHFWAPSTDFNPMAIVFPPFRRAKRISFYRAFRDCKHGNQQTLKAAEDELFAYVDRL